MLNRNAFFSGSGGPPSPVGQRAQLRQVACLTKECCSVSRSNLVANYPFLTDDDRVEMCDIQLTSLKYLFRRPRDLELILDHFFA